MGLFGYCADPILTINDLMKEYNDMKSEATFMNSSHFPSDAGRHMIVYLNLTTYGEIR